MLEDYRKKIDEIDDKIAALYSERMDVVKRIAEAKKAAGTPVLNAGRERAILTRLTKNAPADQRLYLKQVYDEVLETSRAYQRRLMGDTCPLTESLRQAMSHKVSFPAFATVACQGIEGAYSGVAAEKLFNLFVV